VRSPARPVEQCHRLCKPKFQQRFAGYRELLPFFGSGNGCQRSGRLSLKNQVGKTPQLHNLL
jgi:hypothetical protein